MKGKFNVGKSIQDRPKDVRKWEEAGYCGLDTVISSQGHSEFCLATFDLSSVW